MKRRLTLGLLGLGPLSFMASKIPSLDNPIVDNLIKRWKRSKEYTLAVLDTMPAEELEFKPSQEQMSFAQHFMHIGFTNNSFIGILMDQKTYPDFNAMMQADFFLELPDPINLFQPDFLQERAPEDNKTLVSGYVSKTFDYVIESLESVRDQSLTQGLDKIKPWYLEGHTNLDLILRAESHTAHHRAQAVSYLRVKGIRPPGYSKYNTL
ncbi:DinB family protein [Flagellimonas zhangzhouensis]|uniref:DinB superfamily protein n=1 Tax=Flagellimonas zhangzhouensis TaxID=1073328 RepID=A0A1H2Z7Q9_9FLAO|nr:DinB family protein [Allomuricauda zhangzhouensis]SDR07584.1 DinB superfamily protein [Allomuricauda zhangzhouensis]SDX13371.1 DinB superfamily protein [Allomuricauda zhangzhouensis]